MATITLEEFAAEVKIGRAIAGLDLGTRTIGIAVSDLSLKLAHPRPVLKRTKFTADANKLKQALDRDGVRAIVLGLPLNMDGSSGPRVQATRAFARSYGAIDERPMLLWDERLSTVTAEWGLLEADVSRRKRAGRIDSAAACVILQGVLDQFAPSRT